MISTRVKSIAVFLMLAIALTSCSLSNLGSSSKEKEVPRNIYTNLPGQNGEVLAVKFDDTTYAHPQEGVESADVVFVTQVEAGLTRLMGIYSSNYPELLGPIRSARISDIDILAQFGKVGFIYSGAQTKLRPVLAAANIENLSAERNPPTIYFNDPTRTAPYAMMVKPNLLLEKASELSTATSVGWEHGPKSNSAKKIESVKISWPNATYEASWSKSEKRFLLKHDGRNNLATSGVHLGSPMMVIQLISITPSEYGDKFGGITPKSHVVGEGVGYLLRNGSATKVNWSRADANSKTVWSLPNGDPAYFAPGQVWFFLTDREPEFVLPVKKPNKSGQNK